MRRVVKHSRINPLCKEGETKHDKQVKAQGYCSDCGKCMTIERLRKLYNE